MPLNGTLTSAEDAERFEDGAFRTQNHDLVIKAGPGMVPVRQKRIRVFPRSLVLSLPKDPRP
jgi:hypothetical protein